MEHWYFYLLVAYGITFMPFFGKYIGLVNTLFHEIGHALFALLTNGKVYSISLFTNKEGVAFTGSRHWVGKVLVSISGYPFASFIAFLSFYFISNHPVTYLLYGLIGVTAVAFVFWIRNFYGFIWCISFVGLLYIVLSFGTPLFQEMVATFISFILLTQSVSTAYIILHLSFKKPKDAGDASNLANATFIPSVIWGGFFFAQSIFFAFFIFKSFILQ